MTYEYGHVNMVHRKSSVQQLLVVHKIIHISSVHLTTANPTPLMLTWENQISSVSSVTLEFYVEHVNIISVRCLEHLDAKSAQVCGFSFGFLSF